MTGAAQDGQAMVELVIVAALVLVPLFLAIPVIGKYLDLRTAAAEAARYAAWERTVWYGGASASAIGYGGAIGWGTNSWQAQEKTDDQIAKEIATRIFSNTGTADSFTPADKSATTFKNDSARPLWVARDGTALLAAYDDVGDSVGNDSAPGTMNKILDPIVGVAATLGPFTLEMKGRYTAAVNVRVKDFDQTTFLPTATKVTFSEANVLLANGWNAGGPDSSDHTGVKQQVAGLTPTSIFDKSVTIFDADINIMDVIQTILMIAFPELSPRKLELGKIEPDNVPADRLK